MSDNQRYKIGDAVRFFDDPEIGIVENVFDRREGYYYLVKFGETVDQNWPGFVYPEKYLKQPESNSEADPEDNRQDSAQE